jgi:hypothetical protein
MIADEMRRLAFIKYLYGIAVEQSHRPGDLKAASILTFHDSIELFLQLAAEHLNEGTRGIQFEQYWERLEPRLSGHSLAEKESMRRLNKLRVNLKHDGTFPSPLSVEGFRGGVTNFFEANTPLVFDSLEFADISMLALVAYPKTRASLTEAQELMRNNQLREATDRIAIAFAQLIDEYEDTKRLELRPSRFRPGPRISLINKMGQITDAIEDLQDAVRLLSLGFDYRRFARFDSLTPRAKRTSKGDHVLVNHPVGEPTLDDCRYCFEFVIEGALGLQDSEFAVK